MRFFYTVLLSSKRQTTLIPFTPQRASHPERGDTVRRGLCLDKDTPQFATRCRSHSTSPAWTKAGKTEALRFPPQIIQDCIWWCFLCPLSSLHIQDQRKVSKKYSASQIKNHHEESKKDIKKIKWKSRKKHFKEILVSKIPKKGTPEKCKLLRLKTNRALSCSCGMKTDDQGNSQWRAF